MTASAQDINVTGISTIKYPLVTFDDDVHERLTEGRSGSAR